MGVAARSDGVGDRSGGVTPSGGCGPGVVAGLVLLQCPVGSLFGVVVVTAVGTVDTHIRSAVWLVVDKETVTCALNLRSHHYPVLIDLPAR